MLRKQNAPVFYMLLGLVGCWLYWAIYSRGEQILTRGTLPEILLWVLTAAVFAGAFVIIRGTQVGEIQRGVAWVGNIVYALGTATLMLESPKGPAGLILLYRTFVCLSAAALLAELLTAKSGKTVKFLVKFPPCVLALLHLVECYQLWSEKPLVLDYFFGLGAVLCLMMFSYHRLARSVDLPAKAIQPLCGLLGSFFGVVAAMQGEFTLFFAAAAVWMMAEMTNLQPKTVGEATDAAA